MGGFRPIQPNGNIADLLLQRGDILAGRAARSGQIWGNVVNQLGQIGAGAIQQHQAQKEQSAQSEALTNFISNLPDDPEEVLRGSVQILGPDGVQFAEGISAYRVTAQKAQAGEAPTLDEFDNSVKPLARMYKANPKFVQENWGGISQSLAPGAQKFLGITLGQDWRPEYGQFLETYQEKPNLIRMNYTNSAGQDVEELVPEVPGAMRVSTPRAAGGNETERLMAMSPDEQKAFLNAKRRISAATRAPEQPVDMESLLPLAGGIADYSIRPSAALLRSREGREIMAQVRRVNPTYDQTKFDARNALRKDFTSGKTANNMDSLNTAVDHLDTLKTLAGALSQKNTPVINAVINKVSQELGKPEVTNVHAAATAVESEVASLLKKTGATDQEIASWRSNFDINMSPAQWQGSINTVLKIMRGRERAIQHRWKVGMDTEREYPIYGEEQNSILDSLGYFSGPSETSSDGGAWQTETSDGEFSEETNAALKRLFGGQ